MKRKVKFKFDKKKAKDIGGSVVLAVVTVAAAVAKDSLEKAMKVKANEHIYKKSTYAGVISTVMSSDMWSSDKEKLIEIIPKDADSDLYGSIIAVLMGDSWSSDKVRMVSSLCKKIAIPTTARIEKEEVEDE